MKRSSVFSSAFNKAARAVRHPLTTFKGLSSNGKLAVFLTTILAFTGIFSLIYVVSTSGDNREETVVNNFETQVATLTPLQASITRIDGNVEYKTSNGEWEKASENITLGTEDEIKTEGAASRAIVRYENGSEMRLDGDTHARIKASSVEKIEMYLLRGKLYNRIASNATPYSVESDDAHYESLGTVFVTESSGDKQAVEVIESSIIETKTNNTISEGNRYIVKSVVDPTDNEKVEKIDINTYKEDPFIEWNLAIDTASDEFKDKLGFLQDTEAPEIQITSPAQDEIILTEATSDTGSVTIKGKAPGAVSIKIIAKSISGAPVTDVDVKSDATFTSPALDSPLGLSVFEVEARDSVGNISSTSLRVTIQQKSAPPEDDSGNPILLLKSGSFKKDKVTLTWYISEGISDSNVKILYSKQNNPTLKTIDGVFTPSKGSEPPATITNSFDVSGLDKTTYYFRICEVNETDTDCKVISNTVAVQIQ